MKRKRRKDQENVLGRSYAEALRDRATLLRTDFLVSKKVRRQIADDLEALAQLAETKPECFKDVK